MAIVSDAQLIGCGHRELVISHSVRSGDDQVRLHGPCPAKPCQRGAKPESYVTNSAKNS
jgi:hypothetical protein